MQFCTSKQAKLIAVASASSEVALEVSDSIAARPRRDHVYITLAASVYRGSLCRAPVYAVVEARRAQSKGVFSDPRRLWT